MRSATGVDPGRKWQWGTPTKKWYGKKPNDGRVIYGQGTECTRHAGMPFISRSSAGSVIGSSAEGAIAREHDD